MGKVLIIKGADFSAVAVKEVPIDGKIMLSRTNYESIISAYLYALADPARYSPNDTARIAFWPIRSGQVLFVPGGLSHIVCVGLVNTTDVSAANIFSTDSGFVMNEGAPGDIVLRANADCYAMVQLVSTTGVDMFPDGAYIADSAERADNLTMNNFVDSIANKYMKADGTWGETTAPSGKKAGYAYLVQAGDVISITAKSSQPVLYALIKFVSKIGENPATFAQGSRTRIEANNSGSVTVAHDCMLYIYGYDGNTEYFPDSITIQ